MKVIIAGTRTINNYGLMCQVIEDSGFEITEVISGCALGIDTLALKWASEHNIPVQRFYANWNAFGKAAGMVRNGEMAKVGDALIAIWTDNSRGTYDMIQQATERGLKVYVYEVGVGTYTVNC